MTVSPHDTNWSLFKNGDINALERIYRENIKPLINYGLKITNDLDLIKDTIQDLFIELWKSRQNLSDTDHPKFYLFRVLRNKLSKAISNQSFVSEREMRISLDSLRTEYVEQLDGLGFGISPVLMAHTVHDNTWTYVENEQQLQNRHTLKLLLGKLPKRQQEAIYLRFYQNFSYEVIASMMDMNYQSVLNIMQRALKSLRNEYAPSPPHP